MDLGPAYGIPAIALSEATSALRRIGLACACHAAYFRNLQVALADDALITAGEKEAAGQHDSLSLQSLPEFIGN